MPVLPTYANLQGRVARQFLLDRGVPLPAVRRYAARILGRVGRNRGIRKGAGVSRVDTQWR